MPGVYIVDTHALLWYLGDSERLGAGADAALSDLGNRLVVPAIALAEACWIIERGRVAVSLPDLLGELDADSRISVQPLDRAIIERSAGLSAIAEMHDRQTVATALVLQDQVGDVAVITRDGNITDSGLVRAVW
jgi:PIN domain nuclease of toxin-antitoxin system